MTERTEWVVLGRVVGTGTGWDQADTFVMQIYDFEPAENVGIPAKECVTFNFEEGKAQTYHDDGTISMDIDLITALIGVNRK